MFLFSLVHIISATAAAFPVQVRLDRERMYCDVLTGVGLCAGKKKLLLCLAHKQNGSGSLSVGSLFSFFCCFGLFSDLVLRSYLSVRFQLFLPSFSAQWSFGKTK